MLFDYLEWNGHQIFLVNVYAILKAGFYELFPVMFISLWWVPSCSYTTQKLRQVNGLLIMDYKAIHGINCNSAAESLWEQVWGGLRQVVITFFLPRQAASLVVGFKSNQGIPLLPQITLKLVPLHSADWNCPCFGPANRAKWDKRKDATNQPDFCLVLLFLPCTHLSTSFCD